MRDFNYSTIREQKWDSEILGLIAAIYKEAGKQELYLKQRPEELEKLVEIAKIQSTEASNAIEGIVSTTIQRETKLFLGADNEETAELTVPMYDFGDWASRMKAYRKKNHITQQELAQLMGVKHFTLRSWEQKQAKPPYNVWRLHKHLFDDSIKLT